MRTRRSLLMALIATLLLSCGVEEESKVSTTGSGAAPPPQEAMAAAGAITGLGPMEFGGTTLDESGTTVLLNADAGRAGADLRLGMTADLTGLLSASTAEGRAAGMQVQSSVVGGVESLSPTGRSFRLVGADFVVDQNTLFENVSGFDALRASDRVEVFGLRTHVANRYLATRVSLKTTGTTDAIEAWGPLAAALTIAFTRAPNLINGAVVSTTAGTSTFRTDSPTPVSVCISPCLYDDGTIARVVGRRGADGPIAATRITTGYSSVRPEGQLIVLDGFVTQLRPNGLAVIQGEDVDLSATGLAGVTIGTRVQLRGRKQQNVVRASTARAIAANERITYALEGSIGERLSATEFMLRGERINAATAVVQGGTLANIEVGRRVQVRGVAGAGRLEASAVTFR
jgi:hypothetical protein